MGLDLERASSQHGSFAEFIDLRSTVEVGGDHQSPYTYEVVQRRWTFELPAEPFETGVPLHT